MPWADASRLMCSAAEARRQMGLEEDRVWELMERALDALDAAEEKAELIALISAAQAAQSGADDAAQELAEKAEATRLAQLRTELEGTTLRALQKRARQRGVDAAANDFLPQCSALSPRYRESSHVARVICV